MSQETRNNNNKGPIHLTAQQRLEAKRLLENHPEIKHAITGGRDDVDAEECFLPIFMMLGGLWGGSRLARGNARAGGMFGGGAPRAGAFGGYGAGRGLMGRTPGYGGPDRFGGYGGRGMGAFGRGFGGFGGYGAGNGYGGYGGGSGFGGFGGGGGFGGFPFIF